MARLTCKDDCMGNGFCDLGKCVCNPQYRGENCSIKDEDNCPLDTTGSICGGNGLCKFNLCFCFKGYKVSC